MSLTPPPLGLYVHLPWCVRKCPYCDFNSHEVRNDIPAQDYLSRLIEDLQGDLASIWGRLVSHVYLGGGTPSLFSGEQFDVLFGQLRSLLTIAPGAEITLEANPGTVERDSFSAYHQAGINRVSLGVQSFDNDALRRIGRIHGAEEIGVSLDSLHRSGIDNFNIDLMFGLPEQSVENAVDDIHQAIDAGATHISHYQLTLEPNTLFAARPPELPEDDPCWQMQEQSAAALSHAGFHQYEISAWARPGYECRHNLNYWRYGDYLGIGAGAHGKITDAASGRILRSIRHKHPERYLTGDFVANTEEVADVERVFEFFLNRLRLRESFTAADFTQRTGLDWSHAQNGLQQAQQKGLLEERNAHWRHTSDGWRFINDIQALFLP